MKILLLSWNFPPTLGGIEYVVGNLFEGLCRAGHDVRVVTGAAREPARDRVDRAPRTGLAAYQFFALCKGWALCRSDCPDVIVCGSVVPGPAAWLLSVFFRRPVVILVHGSDVLHPGWVYQRVSRFLFRRATRLAANSRPTRDLLVSIGIEPDRIDVIHPGVRVNAYASEPPPATDPRWMILQGKQVLLSVGRLIRRKGLLEFVREVMPSLVESHPDVVLVIVGDDAQQSLVHGEKMREQISTAVHASGLHEHVLLAGTLPDEEVVRLFFRADVFVLPCLDLPDDVEGFGIVFLEAALAGTPSVATRVGGIPDAVVDGETGLLVSPGEPAEMLDAIRRLLADASLCGRLAEQGAARARSAFSWDVISRQYADAFARCKP